MNRLVLAIIMLFLCGAGLAADRYLRIVSPEGNAVVNHDSPGAVSGTGKGLFADDVIVGFEDREAMLLGHRVQAVREAIRHPDAPQALQAITDLGHDQRYYVMVRGWLAYQLQGDMSIVEASRGRQQAHIRTRIRFLKRAIRAIDLE